MARRPRSRASRAERRMLKERAASAIKHGLPGPPSPPARARLPDVPYSRVAGTSSVPPSGSPGSSANRRMPLAVKLLGIGLLLLGAIYGLTLFRDHHSETEAAAPPAETATAPSRASTPLAAVQAVATDESTPPSTSNASLPAPLNAAVLPAAAAIQVPSARPPLAAAVATKPTAAAPIPRKMPAIGSSSTRPTAAAVVAPAPTAAAPRKVDNPY